MPTFVIDAARRVVVSTAVGRLTLAEIVAHHEEVARHPDFDPGFRQLIDFTGLEELAISPDDALRLQVRTPWSPNARRAVAAPGDDAFGMSRLFKGRAGLADHNYGVFRTVEEAWTWLGVDGDIPGRPGG